jgi:hypothetical protein
MYCRIMSQVVSDEKGELIFLIERLNLLPKLTAMGFFDVGRSTLTSVFSTIATYLFIIIQFQQTDQSDKKQ